MKETNLVKILGTVMDCSADIMMVKTTDRTFRGDEYSELHEVHADNHGFKPEDRVQFFGELKTTEGAFGPKTIIAADKNTLKKALKKDADVNIAKIIGRNPQAFQFFPRAEGKMAFGNLLVLTGEENNAQFHRGVFFGNLAHLFSRMCSKNSIVQLIGRIKNREYTDQEGESRTMLEIMTDPDRTKVLKRGVTVDEFADYDPTVGKAETMPI